MSKENTIEGAISQQNILAKEIYNKNLKPALLDKYNALGEEIALILSDFKCENCEKKEVLTFHHLVSRTNKQVLPVEKYYAQRRYYRNIVILCIKCHKLVDGQHNHLKPISKGNIAKIKKYYNISIISEPECLHKSKIQEGHHTFCKDCGELLDTIIGENVKKEN